MSTTTRRRPQPTAEEIERRTAERRAARMLLSATADAALSDLSHSPQRWADLLWTAAHHPDRNGVVNLALIARQAPQQTVATYYGWQEQGRQVRRGETARVRVFTTVLRRDLDETADTASDTPAPDRVAAFRVGSLFTHAQTDPETDPETDPQTCPQGEEPIPTPPATPRIPNPRRPVDITPDQLTASARAARPEATDAESASTAHLAALILGTIPGPAPLPDMPLTDDDGDEFAAVKATAAAVIATGRHIAAELTS